MRKVVVVGELNVDLIMNRLSQLPKEGKEVLAKDMTLTLGSSSAIFASNLSVLGLSVSFAGKVGRDSFGQLVIDSLHENGVDTKAVVHDKDSKTGATVALNFGNERAMVTYPGTMATFHMAEIDWELLQDAAHLHVSSVFLQPALKPDLVGLFARAKSLGMTTSLDVQWDPAERWDLPLQEILPLVDLFLPNEVEVKTLTKCDDVESAMRALSEMANVVVVKLGQKGSLAMENGVFTHVPPFTNDAVVDAIGAGDSFNAGFVYGFLQQKSIKSCQVLGNLMGAISTTAAGGTGAFSTRDNVMEIARTKFNFSENDIER